MPRAPSELAFLQSAMEDLRGTQSHNPDHAERILRKVHDWQEKIEWGRVPQEHLTYLTGSPDPYNVYRERVGNAGHRVVYEISGGVMTVVAVLPKGEATCDLADLASRMSEE